MKNATSRIILASAALAAAGLLAFALWPAAVPVETGAVVRGPLRVTVDEDGKTYIRERYTVSAPLAGRLGRIVLKAGDVVRAGETVVATIDPGDPALLDPRARAQAEARVKAAEAALQQAEATRSRAGAALEQAQSDLSRLRQLQERGSGRLAEIENAVTAEAMRSAEHKAAGFAAEIARFELEQARAALLHSTPTEGAADWRFTIRAPVSGRVLRVVQESEAVVAPGSPILELGDPSDLEVRVDVLSTEAVVVRPGNPVTFERWGGDRPLGGVVRLVEPSAFTKISALGVEEQRVYIVADLSDPPESRETLGDGFRVEARIVVWEEQDVLKVPASSLFRSAEAWTVFAVRDGRARATPVQVGRRNADSAQVLSGLAEGDIVVVYPGDKVFDGVRVVPR